MAEKFSFPRVKPPTLEELREISGHHGFVIEEDELKQYREHMVTALEVYGSLNNLVSPTLPVKYPRTPGYRPEPSDNKYNAWYWRCDIKGASDGLLKGKKVGIKDSVCVAGVPMTNGSAIMEGFVPDIDATVVTRILDAGGNIVGKTSCENLCFSGSSWTNATGPTLNPFDPERSTGGSSGGSAAAIQNGEIDMAIGGDQGGSIRIPACWCGIVGHKPTYGLVPYTGACPIEISVDHVGPMAKNVTDCALLLEAIAGYDEGRDSRQPRDVKTEPYSKLLESCDLKGKKVGLVKEGFDGCESDVQDVVKTAARKLEADGAVVEEVSMPLHAKGLHIWMPICTDGAYECMLRGCGTGYGYKGLYMEQVAKHLREGTMANKRNYSEPLILTTLAGHFMQKNYGSSYYAKAQNLNMKLTAEYDKLLETYDVLVMPTLPYKPPLLPKKDSTVSGRLHNALGMLKNTAPFDITGHPALSMNAGMSEGLPVGLQFVGKQFDDVTVLQFARALEKRL